MVQKRLDGTGHIRKMVFTNNLFHKSKFFLQSVNKEPKAILFYDNCSAHPQFQIAAI